MRRGVQRNLLLVQRAPHARVAEKLSYSIGIMF